MLCKLVSFFNKGITDLSKLIKGLLIYMGGNKLNDHDENFSKTSKKMLYKSPVSPQSQQLHHDLSTSFPKFIS